APRVVVIHAMPMPAQQRLFDHNHIIFEMFFYMTVSEIHRRRALTLAALGFGMTWGVTIIFY
ncbi:hypothetical protein, partial [Fluoribacter gormanii]|uniref:hypothetical protein n=1 Tax=Fluoribacter gormanii TaxID=464 RepID=UPI001B8064A4